MRLKEENDEEGLDYNLEPESMLEETKRLIEVLDPVKQVFDGALEKRQKEVNR